MEKPLREKGKVRLSRMFQKLEKGDRVAVVREISQKASFPKRLQGQTGVIKDMRGNSYIVDVMMGNMEKRFIISSIHLKKLK